MQKFSFQLDFKYINIYIRYHNNKPWFYNCYLDISWKLFELAGWLDSERVYILNYFIFIFKKYLYIYIYNYKIMKPIALIDFKL